MLKRIMIVFGTRPEAIKLAPLIHKLKEEKNLFEVFVCSTGQHREMLKDVLSFFEIVPDFDLDIMVHGQDLTDVTTTILRGMREVIGTNQPDIVFVHGDTTTAFAVACASFFAGVPVGHIEAGLRTGDLTAPYPEEFNRQVVSRVAKFHFAPTERAKQNLLREGVSADQIFVTGNTVIDTLQWTISRLENEKERIRKVKRNLGEFLPDTWSQRRYVLVTGHRRENFGKGFLEICHAIKDLAEAFDDVHFIYPVHLNPNVSKPVLEILSGIANVKLIPPQEYEEFIYLLKNASIVLTDSGGIQEEAPSLGKPVLVMREVTERPEGIESGTVALVGAKKREIFFGVKNLLEDSASYQRMAKSENPYGDGKACLRISHILRKALIDE